MLIYFKQVFSRRFVTSLQVLAVTLLLIGLDHIVPSIFMPTSVFVTAFPAVGEKENDYQDLIYTLQEKKMLEVFRNKVAHKLLDTCMRRDFYLIKYLRSADHNIQKAEYLLWENMKWRENNQIDNILNEDFSEFTEDYVLTTNTHDKKGRPIAAVNLGHWDLRRASLEGKMLKLLRYAYWYHETLFRQVCEAQERGEPVSRALILNDMEGYNFFQQSCAQCISYQTKLLLELQDHYPMLWHSFVSINTPQLFNLVINASGGMMNPKLKEILIILSHDKRKWMEYLDERIDRDQRYTNFGGTRQLKDQ